MSDTKLYLDTHVVVWLFAGDDSKLSATAKAVLNSHFAKHALYVSPMVVMELAVLYETKRIGYSAEAILSHLENSIGLQICQLPFAEVASQATGMSWTRDPFDRLIVAQASVNNQKLMTKDKTILANYEWAVW